MKVTLRSKKLKAGNLSYYLDYYDKGKRNFEFLDIKTTGDKKHDKALIDLANSIRAKRELEIKNQEFGFDTKFKREASFIDYYERVKANKTGNLGTWRTALFHLKNFLNGEGLKFADINVTWLETYKNYLLVQVNPGTARGYYACIVTTLNQAVKDGIIPFNPCNKTSNIKAHNTKRAYLEYNELLKLNETACSDKEVKRAFLFSCYSGLRLGDVRALQWKNIQGNHIEFIQKKTNETLYIPLHETAAQLIGEPGEPDKRIFKVPSDSYLSVIMKTWIEQAGISKRITFHSARHTFATLGLTYGADIYTVSKLLGHSRIETTLIYARIIDEKKRKAIDGLPGIEVNNGR